MWEWIILGIIILICIVLAALGISICLIAKQSEERVRRQHKEVGIR